MTVKKISSIEIIKPGSKPDVDTDFHTEVREKVLEHVTEEYGVENISNIGTFSRLAAKGAFKAMCTIYQIPFAQANKIVGSIPPPIEGVECTIEELFDPSSDRYAEGEEFREATSGSEWTKIVEGAKKIEGRVKSTGVHACGIVISSDPIKNVIPIQVRESDNRVISQWSYPECEALGLVKMDFLGLDTVDLIQNSVQYIMKAGKTPPNMLALVDGDMDDPSTYQLLQKGETMGVFQLASPGVQDLLRRMVPKTLDDIAAATALYRPGPMGMQSHIRYADRNSGREEKGVPVHEDFANSPLEDILGKTQNLCVFQEQILQIASQIAGMTLQEGDDLRKAMGKKKIAVMQKMMPKFFEGAKANGYSDEAVSKLWDTIAEFAKYGFNRCLDGGTKVALPEGGKITIKELYEKYEQGESIEILSMFENGEIKPHAIKNIVNTGRKPLYKIKTASGRNLRLTEEHRMLTTTGYRTIADGGLKPGVELMNDPNWTKRIDPLTKQTRMETMASVNRRPQMRQNARDRMTQYQATITFEDRSKHQKEIQKNNPNRTDAWQAAALKRNKELRKDPEWMASFLRACEISREKIKGKTRGYGVVTEISDGRVCDSMCEAIAAEYLLDRGIDFELHKTVISPDGKTRVSDFYADGVYYEMDGLQRGRQHFIDYKYGDDIPFVYLTPQNYKDAIDESLMNPHVLNGDEIVEIIEPKILPSGSMLNEMTYDIEMEDNGPSNFVAEGLVSHNSHSYAYAITAYQCAYLKANYPVEFMSALLAQTDDKDKLLAFIKEARRMGLKVGRVDVNASDVSVAPDYRTSSEYDIVYGLSGVNGISKKVAQELINEREENGPFTSVHDVVSRCLPRPSISKSTFENLAAAGGFDSFEVSRRSVIENMESLVKDETTKGNRGDSLFDLGDDSDNLSVDLSTIPEYSFGEKIRREANMIGFYLSEHPVSHIGKNSSGIRNATLKSLHQNNQRTTATIAGAITDMTTKSTRKGQKKVSVTIDDGTGYIQASLTPELVKGIDKGRTQQRLKKLYMKGESNVSPDLRHALIKNKEYEAIPEIELNRVYSFEIFYMPSFDGGSPIAKIRALRPVDLAYDGTLPIRIRVDDSPRGQKIAQGLPKKLSQKYPGDYAIHLATKALKESAPEPDQHFIDAALVVEQIVEESVDDKTDINDDSSQTLTGGKATSAKQKRKNIKKKVSKIKQRSWPPPMTENENKYEMNLSKLDEMDYLKYEDTGFKSDKNITSQSLIEKYLGSEGYDFGFMTKDLIE